MVGGPMYDDHRPPIRGDHRSADGGRIGCARTWDKHLVSDGAVSPQSNSRNESTRGNLAKAHRPGVMKSILSKMTVVLLPRRQPWPVDFHALRLQQRLEFGEHLRIVPQAPRRFLFPPREPRGISGCLANVPFNGVKAVTAVGDVGNAQILA